MKELQLDKCPFCSGSASVIKGHGIYGGMADTMNDIINSKRNCI